MKRIAAALLVLLPFGAAEAASLTEAQRTAFVERIMAFREMALAGDMVAMFDMAPPKFIAAQAAKTNEPVAAYRERAIPQMAKAMAGIEFIDVTFDIAAMEEGQLVDGTPYAIVPTYTHMDAPDFEPTLVRGHTVGVHDGGTWYVVQGSTAPVLREAYPGFAAVEIPKEAAEPLGEKP